MDHGSHRSNQPDYFGELAIRADAIVAYIRGTITFRLVSETDHLPSPGIELWMRRKGETGELSLEIVEALGLQRGRIKRIRGSIFFKGQELPVEVYHVGVGSGADFELDRVGEFVAIFSCPAGIRRVVRLGYSFKVEDDWTYREALVSLLVLE